MMKTVKIELDHSLSPCQNVALAVQDAKNEENELHDIRISYQDLSSFDFSSLTFHRVCFFHCNLSHADFSKSSFYSVIFDTCDLSNATFHKSYLHRVKMTECKGIGLQIHEASFNEFLLEKSTFPYSNFSFSLFRFVWFDEVDLKDSEMENCQFKLVVFNRSSLVGMNFFQTSLAGIDFSDNQIGRFALSSDHHEIKNAIFSADQVIELIPLLKIIIK